MTRLIAFGLVVAVFVGVVLVGANLPLLTQEDTANAAATPVVPVSTATVHAAHDAVDRGVRRHARLRRRGRDHLRA